TLVKIDGYRDLSKFEPSFSLIFFAVAGMGLLRGWRRSNAILVSGALFALYPAVLFTVSQARPLFEERSLAAPTFAACLLAGYGALSIGKWLVGVVRSRRVRRFLGSGGAPRWPRLLASAPFAAIMLVAMVTASNSARGRMVDEPYDQAARFLAAVMKPGDVAAGTDRIIYFRLKYRGTFPFFTLVEGRTAQAHVTHARPDVRNARVP